MNLYPPLRGLLFRLDPETAHDLTVHALRWGVPPVLSYLFGGRVTDDPVRVMGLTFPNRVGLAAGLDKNGDCIAALAAMGFGHVEIGTVTPRPQPGNPPPRLFRIPESEAIINRMGFNNKGIDYAVERLRRYRERNRGRALIGVNIGKNKTTPNDKAVEDYLICLNKAYEYADYIAVNISSPNTPGLRDLQQSDALQRLLEPLIVERDRLAGAYRRCVPLVLKIAPDIDEAGLDAIAENTLRSELDGLVVSNTTLSRPESTDIPPNPSINESGGLSGQPLMPLATRVLRAMHRRLGETIPLIGVGGISSGKDAVDKLEAGASLVQIYTGFIYHGPSLIREINDAIVKGEG